MILNCAVLHSDPEVSVKLLSYIDKVPFLTLCGSYSDPLKALREYYVTKVDLYFVGIYPVKEGDIGGMDFCRLLSPATRVVFIASSGKYASDCFRLDALDYLSDNVTLPVFFQSVNKAARWFSLLQHGTLTTSSTTGGESEDANMFYLKVENRIVRLSLDSIDYIESFGDYIKVYSEGEPKPLLSLCSMKYVERKLPGDKFIRIHRSYLVRMACVSAIGRDALTIGQHDLPIGEAYRERVKAYLAGMVIL